MSRLTIGITAVMIFFQLSGYWVTRMYCEKYSRMPRPVTTYYLSRFLRLWPAFAAAILFTFALRWLLGLDARPERLMALSMLGVASHKLDPLNISWSLDIEMQFYLILPLLVPALASRSLRPLALAAILVIAVLGWLLHFATRIETVAGYLPAFAAGALIYLADIRVGPRLALASLAAFVIAGTIFVAAPFWPGLVVEPGYAEVPARSAAMVWTMLLLPFTAYNVRCRSDRRDRVLGDLSYSVYLIHFPIIAAAAELTGGSLSAWEKIAVLALIVAATAAFYSGIERPIERRRAAWIEPAKAPAKAP